ncbi:MAG: twitching motility protein PilT [Pseudomonadota bacterium]|jgi:twitching motility protein PilT
MEKVRELFEQARDGVSSEILLVPFAEPRIRTYEGWVPLIKNKFSGEEVRETLHSILSERQRETLENEGVVTGSVSLGSGFNINFHIYRHKLGFSGSLKTIFVEKSEDPKASMPPVIYEQVLKGKGLILVAGPSWSGKSTLMGKMIEIVNQNQSAHVATVESVVDRIYQSQKSVITSFEVGFSPISEHVWRSLEAADVIGLDIPFSAENLSKVLELVESGKMVIMTLMVESLLALQNRINHLFSEDKREFIFERLAHGLSLFVNQRLVPSLQGNLVLAQEILLFNELLREPMRLGNASEVLSRVQANGEKQGMKTMNKSLLQLFLRKKIDIKQAFFASPDLDDLDRLLSQLGG